MIDPFLPENRDQLVDREQIWTVMDACEGFVRLFTGSSSAGENRARTGSRGPRRVRGGKRPRGLG